MCLFELSDKSTSQKNKDVKKDKEKENGVKKKEVAFKRMQLMKKRKSFVLICVACLFKLFFELTQTNQKGIISCSNFVSLFLWSIRCEQSWVSSKFVLNDKPESAWNILKKHKK